MVADQAWADLLQIIITAVGPKDSTYEQFLAALPETEPRFAGVCPPPGTYHAPWPLAESAIQGSALRCIAFCSGLLLWP